MTLQELIQAITIFAEKETQNIIAELQEKRFDSQGEFNAHARWIDNDPRVIKDKGRNEPLVDTGDLKRQLTKPLNWDLKPRFDGKKLTLSIEDKETFTDSKYDILDIGGSVPKWYGNKGKINPPISSVPARPFKDLSAQDIDWITDQLTRRIKDKYA